MPFPFIPRKATDDGVSDEEVLLRGPVTAKARTPGLFKRLKNKLPSKPLTRNTCELEPGDPTNDANHAVEPILPEPVTAKRKKPGLVRRMGMKVKRYFEWMVEDENMRMMIYYERMRAWGEGEERWCYGIPTR